MKIADLAVPPAVSPAPSGPEVTRLSESDLPFYRKLGRTDLTVSCLGVGGGAKISSENTLYAFEQGINYFFYSSDRHHYLYSHMSDALRQLCGRRSSVREKVVLATATSIKSPEAALVALKDQFDELGIDCVDVLFWDWINSNNGAVLEDCLSVSNEIRGPNTAYQRILERMFGTSDRLKRMGAVRYIGAFFYDNNMARQWLRSPLLDVVMVRHNVAHRSAESEVFNQLGEQDPERPGIVAAKPAGFGSVFLWEAPAGLPVGCWQPKLPDLYRYSLSQNCVDVCLLNLQQRDEIDAAIAGVRKGKLTPAELDYLKLYGDLYSNPLRLEEVPPERLLYCA